MKQIVAQLCGVTMVALIFFFCIQSFWGRTGAFGTAQELAKHFERTDIVSENGVRLQGIVSKTAPQVKADDVVYQVGEPVMLSSCIQVRADERQQWRYLKDTEEFNAELLDISDRNGKSLGKEIYAEENLVDEVISAAGYKRETGELCFYHSGCYELKIKVVGPYGRTAVKTVVFPVEIK